MASIGPARSNLDLPQRGGKCRVITLAAGRERGTARAGGGRGNIHAMIGKLASILAYFRICP